MGNIITRDFRLFNAQQFVESLSEGSEQGDDRTRIYFYIGNPIGFYSTLEYYLDNDTDNSELQNSLISGIDKVTGPNSFSATVHPERSGFGYLSLTNISGTTPPIGSNLEFANGSAAVSVGKVISGRYFPNNPQNPLNSPNNLNTKKKVYDYMIALKRVNSQNVRLTIPRRNWVSGESYDAWNGDISAQNPANHTTTANRLEDSKYYVLTTNFDVFMCIKSGPGASSDFPNTSTNYNSTDKLFTAPDGGDGYIWRHMYTLNISDNNFVNSSYIPISLDRPNESTPFNEPRQVNIRKSGSNLANGTFYMRATNSSHRGGGSAIIAITTSGGIVTAASVQSATGTNFDFLKVNPSKVYSEVGGTGDVSGSFYTSSSATPPILEVVAPPLGGYGSNCADQLNATNIQTHLKLGNSEQEVDFPVDTKYTQLGLIINPKIPNSDTYAIADTLSATHAAHVTTTNGDNFQVGEKIVQGTGDSQAIGIFIEWLDNRSNTGILKYIQPSDLCAVNTANGEIKVNDFTPSGNIVGQLSNATASVNTNAPTDTRGMTFASGFAEPELEYLSGHIHNVIDRKAITRAEDQTENINISISY